jgi:hypothetical protein
MIFSTAFPILSVEASKDYDIATMKTSFSMLLQSCRLILVKWGNMMTRKSHPVTLSKNQAAAFLFSG